MNDKYLNVLKRLYMTNRFKKKKVDLDNIKRGCELFNNPHKNMNYIHVTGTNGKGSVCKKLSSTFLKSGMKTGMFISPHITSFRERIQIDNQMIEKEYIVEELDRIYNILDKNNVDLTYFELVTLLCFNYYKEKKVDIGVIEVGLGGNLDATNVVDPLMSIITSIGMDHMDSLGFTQREIAEKKAGIIKANRPAVIGVDCNPRDVFVQRAKEVNSELFMCEDKAESSYHRDFEVENNQLVVKSVEILKKTYPHLFSHIKEEHVQYGISQKQPCRKEDVISVLGQEIISKNLNINSNIKKIYLDVAHNPHAMEKLLSSLREEFPKDNLIIVCGLSSSKDKNEIFKIISSYADQIYFVANDHPRITKYEILMHELKDWLTNYNYDKSLFFEDKQNLKGDINKVIHKVIEDCANPILNNKSQNVIAICGSFFIMKDARKTLGYIDEEDPVELNEINVVKFSL